MSISTSSNGATELELTRLRDRCADLTAERDQLREELAKMQVERDQYLKTVYHFMCKDYVPPDFTKEEVLAHLNDKPAFDEVVAEIIGQQEQPE